VVDANFITCSADADVEQRKAAIKMSRFMSVINPVPIISLR